MDTFSLEINFSGKFVKSKKGIRYAGGKNKVVRNCDGDLFSLFVLRNMLKDVGVLEWKDLHYCVSGYKPKDGLRILQTDEDVLSMVASVNTDRYVKLYVEHNDIMYEIGEGSGIVYGETYSSNNLAMSVYDDSIFNEEDDENFESDENKDENEIEDEDEDFEYDGNEDEAHDEDGNEADYVDEDENENEEINEEENEENDDYSKKGKIPLDLGMIFSSLEQIKDIVRKYALKHGYGIRFAKSEKNRLRAVCTAHCRWVMLASKLNNEESYQIRTLVHDHNCARTTQNKMASSKYIAQKYLKRFKSQPDWSISDIVETVQKDLDVKITPILAYRARRKARLINDGNAEEQYTHLWRYGAEIRRSNPGSTFVVDLQIVPNSESRRFQRAYMCLRACIDGLLVAGRPVICLDGCHLKGPHTGQILTAVSIDGNDGIYPVAVAVVESECKESWKWFLDNLLNNIMRTDGLTWTFMCDRQNGLVPALEELAHHDEHRFCWRHLHNNFKNKFPGIVYKEILWKASMATTEQAFTRQMKKLEALNKEAYTLWAKTPPKYWSKHAFSPISKCDMRLNNLSESFNSMISAARDKLILTLFETIRKIIMTKILEKQKEMMNCTGLLCPHIKTYLIRLEHASRNWSYIAAGGNRFEVSNGDEQYAVDMNIRSCSCFAWTLTGIPCVHSIPCIRYLRQEIEEFVHEYYHRQTFIRMYSHYIAPINGMSLWPEVKHSPVIIPPLNKKQPGRPRKKRIREVDEPASSSNVSRKNRVMRCSKCNGVGHNVRKCGGVNSNTYTTTSGKVNAKERGRGRAIGQG